MKMQYTASAICSIFTCILILIIISAYGNIVFCQNDLIKSKMSQLTDLNAKILSNKSIIKEAEKIGVKTVSPKSLEQRYELDDIRKRIEIIKIYDADRKIVENGEVDIQISNIGKYLSSVQVASYQKLFYNYQSSLIDNTFFSNPILIVKSAFPTEFGFFTQIGGTYYNSKSSSNYWYPTGKTSRFQEPLNNSWITGIYCEDATEVFPKEWAAYTKTKAIKEQKKEGLTEYLNKNLVSVINEKREEEIAFIKPLLSDCLERQYTLAQEYDKLVLELKTMGIAIPNQGQVSIGEVSAAIEKYRKDLLGQFLTYQTQLKQGDYLHAASSLFYLYIAEESAGYGQAHNEIAPFIHKHKDKVLIKTKDLINTSKPLSISPLAGYLALNLIGLHNPVLLNNVFNSNSISEKELPNMTINPDTLYSVLREYGLEVPTIIDYKAIVSADNNSLVNIYKPQVNARNTDKMTTDNYGYIGLLGGDLLLLLDEKGLPNFYSVHIDLVTVWGQTKANVSFVKYEQPLSTPFAINIRIKLIHS